MSFSCETADGMLRLCFEDDGLAYDPTAAEIPEKPFEEFDRGGMGLSLLRRTASDIRYERTDGRNRLTLTFRPESTAAGEQR